MLHNWVLDFDCKFRELNIWDNQGLCGQEGGRIFVTPLENIGSSSFQEENLASSLNYRMDQSYGNYNVEKIHIHLYYSQPMENTTM